MMHRKRTKVIALLFVVAIVGAATYINTRPNRQTPEQQTTTKTTPQVTQEPEPEAKSKEQPSTPPSTSTFDTTKYSTSEPGSLWWVVNKTRPLPTGYTPSDLITPNVSVSGSYVQFRKVAQADLEAMFTAAAKANAPLTFNSGYRSESVQRQLYNGYVANDGQAAADRYSARPGTSEHQTGLSFDAGSPSGSCYLEICFGKTTQGLWLAANAHKFGFIVRYPDGKESITGYQYEPWHMRYVGAPLATEMKTKGVTTLEEFFNLPAAPTYKN